MGVNSVEPNFSGKKHIVVAGELAAVVNYLFARNKRFAAKNELLLRRRTLKD